jgi:hypothetical protein
LKLVEVAEGDGVHHRRRRTFHLIHLSFLQLPVDLGLLPYSLMYPVVEPFVAMADPVDEAIV